MVNVNVKQIQVARTLDQLSKHPANCQFFNHLLVEKLIGTDRQMGKRVVVEDKEEERGINRGGARRWEDVCVAAGLVCV